MSALKPNTQRALNLLMLLWVFLGLSAVAFGSGIYRYFLIRKGAAGEEISAQAAETALLISNLVAVVTFIVYFTCMVMFIMWFRRAYYNLHQLTSRLSFREGWAAGAWFVPIISLYRPYQIMKEMYEETDLILTKDVDNRSNLSFGHLPWWWGLWLFANLFSSLVLRYSLTGRAVWHELTPELLEIVDSFISIPLTLITIRVVKEYAIVEDDLVLLDEKEKHEPGEHSGIFTESEYRRYL